MLDSPGPRSDGLRRYGERAADGPSRFDFLEGDAPVDPARREGLVVLRDLVGDALDHSRNAATALERHLAQMDASAGEVVDRLRTTTAGDDQDELDETLRQFERVRHGVALMQRWLEAYEEHGEGDTESLTDGLAIVEIAARALEAMEAMDAGTPGTV